MKTVSLPVVLSNLPNIANNYFTVCIYLTLTYLLSYSLFSANNKKASDHCDFTIYPVSVLCQMSS